MVTYIVSVCAPAANRHCAILARIQGGVLEHIPPESAYALRLVFGFCQRCEDESEWAERWANQRLSIQLHMHDNL